MAKPNDYDEVLKALDDWRLIAPHVEFRGQAVGSDGKPLDLKPIFTTVASLTGNMIFHDPEKYRVDVRKQPMVAKTILSASPIPNASASSDRIEINLGILLALASLPATTTAIKQFLTKEQLVIEELQRFKPSRNVLDEVHNLMNAWYQSSQSNWTRVVFPQTGLTDFFLFQQVSAILVGHELSHWQEHIYKPTEWDNLMKITENHITSWLSAGHYPNKTALKNLRRLLKKDRTVMENWKREVCADCMGFHLCNNSTGGGWSPKLRMYSYAALSLFFSMLLMLEVFYTGMGLELTVETHPPAAVRRSLFGHIRARELGLSYNDFMFKEWGSGTMVGYLTDVILQEYTSQYASK